MQRLTHEGKKSPLVRQVAVYLVQDLAQKDHLGEIRAVHSFVRDRIRYVRDIRGVETLHAADKILTDKQGDCDDKSILIASLLESLGYKTRFVAVGFHPPVKNIAGKLKARDYSHVLAEVFVYGNWIPLETTEPVDAGWFPDRVESALVVYN